MSVEKLNPPKRSRFAVWRWKKRTWALMAPLILAGYLLSAAPVIYTIRRCELRRDPLVKSVVFTVYFPAGMLNANSEAYRNVLEWQMATMESAFGELP